MRDVRPGRDHSELAVLGAFIESRRPVLAICQCRSVSRWV
jgi:gamma-glutamyl-gamma-aminobutyrate hydrolase PuuD